MLLKDKWHGVDFEQMSSVAELGLNEDDSEQYECTKLLEIKRVFRHIKLPPHSVAVDLGSGKGKVLYFLAKNKNIDKVYGIEISKYLISFTFIILFPGKYLKAFFIKLNPL